MTMKNQVITANSNGIIVSTKDADTRFVRYENLYQSQSLNRSQNAQEMANSIEKLYLNDVQRKMYRNLMYGTKDYTVEELERLHPSYMEKLTTNYKKAKNILHVMKAKRLFEQETKLIAAIFPHVNLGMKDFDWFVELPISVTLKNLGITTKEIVDAFIEKHLLPKNFYELV